ncbi:hypothetical protein QEH56_24570, partial [Pelagicoccus enzymogenes]|uniref:glycosylhydrolase-like jelly roll fold domain-containing protein n=1 Tax=Pelagicoccus enzymogenes TaxID=2773457 RepID=UPI00280F9B3A
IHLDESHFAKNRHLTLDLGTVEVAARVDLNDQQVGTLWTPPFAIDITESARVGENKLRIEVVNQWANRLIGDEQFQNLTGYDLESQLNQTLLIKDPQLSFINRYKMVDWYTANEPAP